MKDQRIRLLGEAPVASAILRLSLPVIAGMIIQVLYNLVDMFFIGMLADPAQVAAVNIVTPLFMSMMALATIVSTGAASYISRCLGQHDQENAGRTLSTGVVITLGLSAAATLLGLLFAPSLVRLLGADEQIVPYAYSYAVALLVGSSIIMGNYTMGQLLRSEGATTVSMIGMMIGTVVNIILDPVFIFALNMDILGAAVATVIGNGCALAYYVWYYATNRSLVKFHLRLVSFTREIYWQIFSIGIPATISQLLVSVAIVVSNNLAKAYGVATVAGIGIASKVMTIGTFIFMGFAAGCQPLIGFSFGARNYPRVNAIIKTAMLMTTLLGVALMALFKYQASTLIAVFAGKMDAVLEQGAMILRALSWSLCALGPLMLANTSVQALGKAKASLFLSFSRQGLFFLPLLFILNTKHGLAGLIHTQPLADGITTLVALFVLASVIRKAEFGQPPSIAMSNQPLSQ